MLGANPNPTTILLVGVSLTVMDILVALDLKSSNRIAVMTIWGTAVEIIQTNR